MRAEDFYSIRAEDARSSGFGALRGVTGFAMPDRLAFGFRVGQRYLAQWLALAANDFWYPSMRRPPKTAAVRVNPPTFFKVFNFHR
jgi:hypothetical protein